MRENVNFFNRLSDFDKMLFAYMVFNLTNRRPIITNRLSFVSVLHVSTLTRSSSGRYIRRHTSTGNSVKRCACVEYTVVHHGATPSRRRRVGPHLGRRYKLTQIFIGCGRYNII